MAPFIIHSIFYKFGLKYSPLPDNKSQIYDLTVDFL